MSECACRLNFVYIVQATLVRNTTDENEARILYEYLAEASVVFPKVFPVMLVQTMLYVVLKKTLNTNVW